MSWEQARECEGSEDCKCVWRICATCRLPPAVLSSRAPLRPGSPESPFVANPGVAGRHPHEFLGAHDLPRRILYSPISATPRRRRRRRRPGLGSQDRSARRHSWNLVCTFILPPSTFLSRPPFLLFSFFFYFSALPSSPALRSAVAGVARRTAGNKWPLMDFLDVCARATELRCSQTGPSKYGGTLNYRNRCSPPLSLSLFPFSTVSICASLFLPFGRSQLYYPIDDENFSPSTPWPCVRVRGELSVFANNLGDIAVTSSKPLSLSPLLAVIFQAVSVALSARQCHFIRRILVVVVRIIIICSS